MTFLKEILLYLYHRKQWWLAPILVLLLLIGLVVIFAESPIAPFIYTLL